MTITDEQIEEIRWRALCAEDGDLVDLCDVATRVVFRDCFPGRRSRSARTRGNASRDHEVTGETRTAGLLGAPYQH